MVYINSYNEYNESIKGIVYGALLFLASCQNLTVKNKNGEIVKDIQSTSIDGKVKSERTIPSKGGYMQFMTIIGNDGNTYSYKIYNSPYLSKSWRIDDNDSVKIVFDSNGNSKVFKK